MRLHLRLIRFLRINRQLAIAVGHAACKEVLPSDEDFSIPSEFEIPTHDGIIMIITSETNFLPGAGGTPKSVGGSTPPPNLLLLHPQQLLPLSSTLLSPFAWPFDGENLE